MMFLRKLIMVSTSLVSSLFQKRLSVHNGEILLILEGGLGDAIIEMQATRKIISQLNQEGKHVTILTTPINHEMYRMFMSPKEVKILSFSCLRGALSTQEKLKSLRLTVKELQRTQWEYIIVRVHALHLRDILFTGPVSAGKKVVFMPVLNCSLSRKFQILNRLYKFIFDSIYNFSIELTSMQYMREISKVFGVESYPIQITPLPKLPSKILSFSPYISVTVDASSPYKMWESEKFIELIKLLLKKYSYDVILTGSNVQETELKVYSEAFGSNERVIDLIGKTALNDWIELIRGAAFHIGVDSSSIHIAASVGTLSFCLVGVWDGNRFYPYQIDEETPGTITPRLVYRTDVDINLLSCRNCASRGSKCKECRVRGKKNKSCLCIDRITVDDVILEIDKAKKEGLI